MMFESDATVPCTVVEVPAVPAVAIVATRRMCRSIIARALWLKAASRSGQSGGHDGADAREQIAITHRVVDQLALARLQRHARELNDLRQDQLQIGEQRAHLGITPRW